MDEQVQNIKEALKRALDVGFENFQDDTHALKVTQSIGNKGGFIIIAVKYPDTDPIRKELLKDSDNSDVEAKFESL